MCLGVPGQVLSVEPDPLDMTMGKVSFGGIVKRVCLAYVPEVAVGDYVVVHVGFAISRIDETQAREMLEFLATSGELAELGEPGVEAAGPEPPAGGSR